MQQVVICCIHYSLLSFWKLIPVGKWIGLGFKVPSSLGHSGTLWEGLWFCPGAGLAPGTGGATSPRKCEPPFPVQFPLCACAWLPVQSTWSCSSAVPASPAWLEARGQGQGSLWCCTSGLQGPSPPWGHQDTQAVQPLLGPAVGTASASPACQEHVALRRGTARLGEPRGSLRLHGEPGGLWPRWVTAGHREGCPAVPRGVCTGQHSRSRYSAVSCS